MNKVVTSAGLFAIGAATVYGYDPEMTRAQSGRPFTVSATVRGFYDDNSTASPDRQWVTTPSGTRAVDARQESFGFEVSPAVHVNLPLEQTFIRAGYVYSLRYYEGRQDDKIDQQHEFNALLRHAFSARHDVALSDSFTYSSEPTVTDRFGIITAPVRTETTAMRNRAGIDYNVALTQVLGLGLGYVNTWYDYDDSGVGSRSAILDRLEHLFRADLRYQFDPTLVALVGYQFGLNSYTGDDFIVGTQESEIRDSYSHYLYVGVDHDFNHKLRGTVRVGGQFIDYHEIGESEVSPYLDAALTYVYLPESSVQVGVRHMRNATDIVAPDASGTPTLDQETTAAFVQVTHRITAKLKGNLFGQVQRSTFTAGAADDDVESLYLVGLNFEYRINHHWAVELGYNYDLLESDVEQAGLDARSYDRNRVYVGVRASY
ncbi:MAG TPA: outer membrane beta-barrel protein [Candidatus Acidoferrum sp.]|nr:outer membrane beta-barrel protein [Candidatus Acidoferrum sp.]